MRYCDFATGRFCFAVLSLVVTFCFVPCSFGAKITAEKSCIFRIDERFAEGATLNVLLERGGKRRKVAVLQVTKAKGNLSLAKLIKGPQRCAALKGAEVELEGGEDLATSGSVAGNGALSALDGMLGLSFSSFASKGMHQNTAQTLPNLNLSGINFSIDFWPGALIGSKSGTPALFGLGVRYAHRATLPGMSDIQVEPPEDSQDKTPGKQRTTASSLFLDVAARYAYLENKMTSELRVGYLRHVLRHALVTQGALPRAPLRNATYSGFFVGLKQRYRMSELLRGNVGLGLPVVLSGLVDNTSESTTPRDAVYTERASAPGGLMIDAGLEAVFSKFKTSLSLCYEKYSSTVPLLDESNIPVSESFLSVIIGAGVLL